MPELGQSAPDFTLARSKTERITLSEQRGRKVVLAFFPAAFTGVCTQEMCSFQDSLAALNDLDALVLGISADGPFTTAEFASRNGLTFPLLADYNREAIRAYGVALENFAGFEGYLVAQRSVFVIDAHGVVRWRWIAPNPGVEPDYEAVKAAVAAL